MGFLSPLAKPWVLNIVVQALLWLAIAVGPSVVDFTDRVSVWRFKRQRDLMRRAAALRKRSRAPPESDDPIAGDS